MYDTKSPFTSKTNIGIAISILPVVSQLLGYDIGDVNSILEAAMQLGGAALGFYGRMKAVKKIKF